MPLSKRSLAVFAMLALAAVLAAAPVLKHFSSDTQKFPDVTSQLQVSGAQDDSPELSAPGMKVSMDGQSATGITVKPHTQSQQGSRILVCVDASGSVGKAQFAAIRSGMEQAIGTLPASTTVAIALFANDFEVICDFTADKDKLNQAIARINTRPGNTYLHFSLEKALKYLTDGSSGSSGSILLISDGKEEVKFDVMTDDDIAAMIKLATTNGIPIHTIGYAKEKSPDYNLLDYFSSRTGGILQKVAVPADLAGFIGTALGSSGRMYTVSYKVCDVKGDGKNHTLKFSFATKQDTLSTEAEVSLPNNGKICTGSGAGGMLKKLLLPGIIAMVAIMAVVVALVLRKRRKAQNGVADIPAEDPGGDGIPAPALDEIPPTGFDLTDGFPAPEAPAATAEEAPFAPDFRDRTMILGPGGVPMEPVPEAEPQTEAPPPEPETEQIMRFTLLKMDILAGPDAGRVFAIDTRGATIGRSDDNGVVVSDGQTSRTHARVYYQDNRFYIQDLQSRNGTIVNAVRITVHEVQHNDTFTIGQNSGNFYLA